MKIGVIADIHANLSALNAVIDDATKNGVDKFICVGDIVGIGPRPKECLDRIRELDLLATVKGNHDECFKILEEDYYDHPKFVKTYIIQMFESKYLVEEDYKYLDNLSYVEYIKLGKLKIKVMHALEENNSYPNLLLDSEQSNFNKMLENDDSDLVIYGHIHRQVLRTTSDMRQIINPGSVGSTLSTNPVVAGLAQYCILTIDDYIVSNEFKSIKYNTDDEVSEVINRDVPYKDLVVKQFKSGEYYGFDEMINYEIEHNYKNIVLEHIKNR